MVLAVCAGLYARVTELPWVRHCIFSCSEYLHQIFRGSGGVRHCTRSHRLRSFRNMVPAIRQGPGQTSEIFEVLLSHMGDLLSQMEAIHFWSPKFLLKCPTEYRKQGQSRTGYWVIQRELEREREKELKREQERPEMRAPGQPGMWAMAISPRTDTLKHEISEVEMYILSYPLLPYKCL